MTLLKLIADLRKTARRIRRRGHLVTMRQLHAWQRRLKRLKLRFESITGRQLRRQAISLGSAAVLALGLSRPAHAAGSIRFTQVEDPGITLLKSDDLARYSHVAFADFDGDGDLDAVAVSDNNQIVYWRNEGTSTQPRWVDKTGTTDSPFHGISLSGHNYKSVTVGDIDGDGDIDVLIGDYSYNSPRLRFFRNTGTATAPVFQEQTGGSNPFFNTVGTYQAAYTGGPPGYYTYGPYYNASNTGSRPVLADMDGDGDLDLVVAEYSNVRYFETTGTALASVFVERSGGANPFNGFSHAYRLWVTVGDLDGDGDLDVIAGGYGSYNAELWRNTGTPLAPVFSNQGDLPLLSRYLIPSLVDYDGDGDLDLFAGSSNDGLSNFENKGGAGAPNFSQPFSDRSISSNPVRADVDSDGDIDILQGNYLWRNNAGVLQLESYSFFNYYSNDARAFGDLDGDGDNDFVVRGGGYLRYFRKDGAAGTLQFTERTYGDNPFNGIYIGYDADDAHLIDMDGDGDLDLVLSRYSYGNTSLQYLRNDGTPTAPIFSLQTGANDPFDGLTVSNYSRTILADLDQDGDIDLVAISSYAGSDRLYRNEGTATVPNLVLQAGFLADRTQNGTPIIVDFDGDGDLDVVLWSYSSDSFLLLRNDSDPAKIGTVDPIAVAKNKPILGPVPAASGQEICVFVPATANAINVELFNLAGEKVQEGLSRTSGGNACIRAIPAPGLYWAKITVDGKVSMQKIIIKP